VKPCSQTPAQMKKEKEKEKKQIKPRKLIIIN
jgi:hypothetical protein